MKRKLETNGGGSAIVQLCSVPPLARLLLVRSRLERLPLADSDPKNAHWRGHI